MSPKLMMFDEPISVSTPEMVKGVLDTMVTLALDGMTTLVVTHEMTFIRTYTAACRPPISVHSVRKLSGL